ncbi:MAG: hypothetical protein LBP75_02520 [Planctomycetota bacterium]|jgi:hypothetical protein|nr:hypothetical protein [Planctomycetota bacterium]
MPPPKKFPAPRRPPPPKNKKPPLEYPRWLVVFAVALVLSGLVSAGLWLYSRYGVTDEERIRHSLATIELAVEARQTRMLMGQVAADYADRYGNNYAVLYDRARDWMALNLTRKVEFDLTDINIEIAADGKTARVTATVGGNEPIQRVLSYIRPQNNRVYLDYRKNALWQVVNCRAEP